MAEPPRRLYWDSCAWIGFLNNEADKRAPLQIVWDEAQKGQCEIWTSTYSYLEVIRGHAEHGKPFRCETCGSEFKDVLAGQIAAHGRLLNSWWCGKASDSRAKLAMGVPR